MELDQTKLNQIQQLKSSWRLFRWWQFYFTCSASRVSFLQALLVVVKLSKEDSVLSPARFLRLYAKEESWGTRSKIHSLADRLEGGDSYADALEQVPDLLSDDDLLAIRLAAQSGTLPQTIAALANQKRASARQDNNPSPWPYFLTLTFAFCLVITFIRVLIAPTFREMFNEFGLKLPQAFEFAFSPLTDIVLMAIPLSITLGLLGLWLATQFGLMRGIRRRIGSFLSTQQHQNVIANTLRMIANSLQMGRPIAGSLATLAHYHHDSRVRMQLLTARNDMELGTNFAESLQNAGLLRGNHAVALSQVESNAECGWLMHQIANSTSSEVAYRRRVLGTIIQPLIVLFFGAITLTICLGIFLVLVKLIASLA